jgi:DNA-binding response OmpR family regulator
VKILLVEDEKSIADFIKKGLSEEYYTVDSASNGDDGLSLALVNRYDLVILDVMLPGISGIELCRRIRKEGIATPVMMLTARDTVRDKVAGLDSGADDYITKPFSFEEFLARVRALTRRTRDAVVELRCGSLLIDPLARRVTVGNREISLRPKEYSILHFLVVNKGRVLSRTRIMENVWGYDFDPGTNVVDVHMKALRDKLGEVSAAGFIRSVRGAGYVIDEPPELPGS